MVLWSCVGPWLRERHTIVFSEFRAGKDFSPTLPALIWLTCVICSVGQESGDCSVLLPLKFLLDC